MIEEITLASLRSDADQIFKSSNPLANDGALARIVVDLLRVLISERAAKPAVDNTPAKPPDCSTCNGTHRMQGVEREVPCTYCQIPCSMCQDRRAPYCRESRCECECHATATTSDYRSGLRAGSHIAVDRVNAAIEAAYERGYNAGLAIGDATVRKLRAEREAHPESDATRIATERAVKAEGEREEWRMKFRDADERMGLFAAERDALRVKLEEAKEQARLVRHHIDDEGGMVTTGMTSVDRAKQFRANFNDVVHQLTAAKERAESAERERDEWHAAAKRHLATGDDLRRRVIPAERDRDVMSEDRDAAMLSIKIVSADRAALRVKLEARAEKAEAALAEAESQIAFTRHTVIEEVCLELDDEDSWTTDLRHGYECVRMTMRDVKGNIRALSQPKGPCD